MHKNETMASPLQSYFSTIAKELKIDLDSTILQPDNARTIKGSFDESLLESWTAELDDSASRWMESSSSSDVTLHVPGRRSSIGTIYPGDTGTKETYGEPSMCATERWLKELPTDSYQGLPSDETPMTPHRARSFDGDTRAEDSGEYEDIPSLKGCRFATDEKYPVSNTSIFDQEGLMQSPNVWEDNNPTSLDRSEDSREDTSTHAHMQKVRRT